MLIVAIFTLGYLAIVFEHAIGVNKAASALLTGVLCWTVFIVNGDPHAIGEQLLHHMGELSQILFFLLGAMTIVELIDAHDGFVIVTSRITTQNRRKLLVSIALLSFFLSAVLDNLTTSIVMMSLVRKLIPENRDRMYYAGVVIIAANSGGAWSPIGDVTTTMLWVGGQITTSTVITELILPSLVSVIIPMAWIAARLRGDVTRSRRRTGDAPPIATAVEPSGFTSLALPDSAAAIGRTLAQLDLRGRTGMSVVSLTRAGIAAAPSPLDPLHPGDVLALSGPPEAIARGIACLVDGLAPEPTTAVERNLVFATGLGVLLFVPVFKTITHLPPFMGILLGLGVLWLVTELIHKRKNDEVRGSLSVSAALERVDSQSILFFLGILLAISALQSDGLLAALAKAMQDTIGNIDAITMSIGLASAIVDNVPLVAAAQGMYSLTTFPTDHHFWIFLAYCAGCGGSILIIGSAAGVAVMGMQRISFGWYLRHMSLPAFLGYAGGAAAYLGLGALTG